jgi:prepilin-type N-terminal cleavage/methylation domain-containing protein
MRQKGFTLVELMVVISIAAVLGALGLAGFASYNKIQLLQTSSNEVVTMLNLAKSRAQSQIKPSDCVGDLVGYGVKITSLSKYTLFIRCSEEPEDDEIKGQIRTLPSKLAFNSDATFFFPVLTGGVQQAGQVIISDPDGDSQKIIEIDSLGRVIIVE